MKTKNSKYIDIEDVKNMRKFYCASNFSGREKKYRINVLIKNLEQILKNITLGKKVVTEAAQEDFYALIHDFLQKCKQEKYTISYSFIQTYKKAMQANAKQNIKEEPKNEVNKAIVQNLQVKTSEEKTIFQKISAKLQKTKQTIKKVAQYIPAVGIAVLSFGSYNTTNFLQTKKEKVQETTKVKKQDICEEKVFVQEEQTQKTDSFISPYQAEFFQGIKANEQSYEIFVHDLIIQFRKNIQTLQSSKTNRKQFYREQEKLIGKYGKFPHIVPQSSCESMSYATFLKVLDDHLGKEDYISQACKDLLMQVPNPHACVSNKKTFNGVYSKNLRSDLQTRLKQNKYGIYMVWIKNKSGNLHRMTVIGSGDNKAYLMAYNNNRIALMDVEKLNKIPMQSGYFCDLGTTIKSKANELVANKINQMQEKIKNVQLDKRYFALLWQKEKYKQL